VVEFSGNLLAFIKLGELIRVVALYSVARLFINAFIWPNFFGESLLFAPIFLYFLTMILCTIVVSLAESLNARFRLLEATKLSGYLLVISSIALVLSLLAGGGGLIR
jgi:formate hydrogenlyase subunit 4